MLRSNAFSKEHESYKQTYYHVKVNQINTRLMGPQGFIMYAVSVKVY